MFKCQRGKLINDSTPVRDTPLQERRQMLTRNYYLVNKETKKVHFLFKLDPYFMSKDHHAESWLGGRLYRSYPSDALTLEELYALDYSDEYEIPGFDHPMVEPFEFILKVNYASYKGYRLYYFPSLVQLYDDFAGNDFMEMNAFLATLFKEYIGPEEVEKWNDEGAFNEKYGVNDLIMSHFTIETDDHEGIHLHRALRDDYDWKGFADRTAN